MSTIPTIKCIPIVKDDTIHFELKPFYVTTKKNIAQQNYYCTRAENNSDDIPAYHMSILDNDDREVKVMTKKFHITANKKNILLDIFVGEVPIKINIALDKKCDLGIDEYIIEIKDGCFYFLDSKRTCLFFYNSIDTITDNASICRLYDTSYNFTFSDSELVLGYNDNYSIRKSLDYIIDSEQKEIYKFVLHYTQPNTDVYAEYNTAVCSANTYYVELEYKQLVIRTRISDTTIFSQVGTPEAHYTGEKEIENIHNLLKEINDFSVSFYQDTLDHKVKSEDELVEEWLAKKE